jgi:serine/threonine-protein kinase RsbT
LPVTRSETVPLRTSGDIVNVRRAVRTWAIEEGFSLIEQTKLVTAASELARNAIVHGGGGEAVIEVLNESYRTGLRLTFIDHGPGIPDIPAAMKDGYTTAGGLGLGLGGAKRLSDQFEIDSQPGKGTTARITRWKID